MACLCTPQWWPCSVLPARSPSSMGLPLRHYILLLVLYSLITSGSRPRPMTSGLYPAPAPCHPCLCPPLLLPPAPFPSLPSASKLSGLNTPLVSGVRVDACWSLSARLLTPSFPALLLRLRLSSGYFLLTSNPYFVDVASNQDGCSSSLIIRHCDHSWKATVTSAQHLQER
ncbi:hypothetical protein LZ31DRAFT_370389 [Colletotrichum somersetense]|nr:hypothetical protein LZ31DRAFT_370389 [Colletotrichum somersetense]